MNQRLFLSLREQLKYEVSFIKNVSRPYFSPEGNCQIIDFKYKLNQYQLVLNGNIYLRTNCDNGRYEEVISSYYGLIQALIKSLRRARVA